MVKNTKLNTSNINNVINKIFVNFDTYKYYYDEVFNGDIFHSTTGYNEEIVEIINIIIKNQLLIDETQLFFFFENDVLYFRYSCLYNIYLILNLKKIINLKEKFILNLFLRTNDITPYYILYYKINDYLRGEDDGDIFNECEKKDIDKYLNSYFIYIDEENFDFFLQDDYIDFISKNNFNFIQISLNTIFDRSYAKNYLYNDKLEYKRLNSNEKNIYNTINNDEYKKITLLKGKEGNIDFIEGERHINKKGVKFTDLEKQFPFADITSKNHNRKSQKYIVNEKIKLKKENK